MGGCMWIAEKLNRTYQFIFFVQRDDYYSPLQRLEKHHKVLNTNTMYPHFGYDDGDNDGDESCEDGYINAIQEKTRYDLPA